MRPVQNQKNCLSVDHGLGLSGRAQNLRFIEESDLVQLAGSQLNSIDRQWFLERVSLLKTVLNLFCLPADAVCEPTHFIVLLPSPQQNPRTLPCDHSWSFRASSLGPSSLAESKQAVCSSQDSFRQVRLGETRACHSSHAIPPLLLLLIDPPPPPFPQMARRPWATAMPRAHRLALPHSSGPPRRRQTWP
jgi:hypothetical protein